MHHTNKYSQHSSVIWPVWLNGWVFVYELSCCGFEPSCSQLNFRFHTCFEQGGPWYSGNYRVWTDSEMHMWHDKNIQTKITDCFFSQKWAVMPVSCDQSTQCLGSPTFSLLSAISKIDFPSILGKRIIDCKWSHMSII